MFRSHTKSGLISRGIYTEQVDKNGNIDFHQWRRTIWYSMCGYAGWWYTRFVSSPNSVQDIYSYITQYLFSKILNLLFNK